MLTSTLKGLSTGAIAGIAVGGVAGAAVLIALGVLIMYKRRNRPSERTVVSDTVQYPPPGLYEKPTSPLAVEADWGIPQKRHEMP